MKYLFVSLFLLVSFYCFSQGNPNGADIFTRIERGSIDRVANSIFESTTLIESEWIEKHKPTKYTMSKLTDKGIADPNYATIEVIHDVNCKPIQITGYVTNKPEIFSKEVIEYDDIDRTITVTWFDGLNGVGPQKEYGRLIFSYDNDYNIFETLVYLYDPILIWDNLINTVKDNEFDSCGNNKYSIDVYDDDTIEYTYTYLIDTCLIKSSVIKFSWDNDEIFRSFIYNSDNTLKYIQSSYLLDCAQINYEYDNLGRRINIKVGDCDSLPEYHIASFDWNLNNSLNWFEIQLADDTISRITLTYDKCENVKVNDFLTIERLTLNSPLSSGDQLIIKDLPSGNFKYSILDLKGHILQSQFLNQSNKIDLPELTNGIYFLQVYINERIWIGKFVKM